MISLYPFQREKEVPGIHCLRMRQFSHLFGKLDSSIVYCRILKTVYITINGWSLQGTVCQSMATATAVSGSFPLP